MRFTPLEKPVTMRSTQITNRTAPIETPKSARNEMCVEAGVRSYPSGKWIASTAKIAPTSTWPMSFWPLRRPRLRFMNSLRKSSTKPTKPRPVIRNSTKMPEAVIGSSVNQCPSV